MRSYSNVVFLLLLFSIQTSQLCFCINSTSACNERDRQALSKFRSSFKHTSGSPLASWEGNDCCHWQGVGCHGITGHVIKLDLRTSSNCFFNRLEAEVMNPSLVELKHLNHLDLSGIYFNHSPIPAFLGSMKRLRYLSLSECGFTGRIPHHLGIIDLNLSHNKLSGEIPSKIGKMASLESIDLSSNRLHGPIPTNMSTLTSLSVLNLSNNNFSGPIPRRLQFSTFGPSSFVGNPHLCGDPLSNPCKGDNDEEKEKILFHFVIAMGFITGFWGVIGILVFKRRWSHALFRHVDDFVETMYMEIMIRVARFKKMINTKLHQ